MKRLGIFSSHSPNYNSMPRCKQPHPPFTRKFCIRGCQAHTVVRFTTAMCSQPSSIACAGAFSPPRSRLAVSSTRKPNANQGCVTQRQDALFAPTVIKIQRTLRRLLQTSTPQWRSREVSVLYRNAGNARQQ
jgi:hypothetical protein